MIDGLITFDWYATLAASGGASANTIDLLADRDLGPSEVNVFVDFTTAIAGGTVQAKLQTSTDNTNWTDLFSTPVFAIGSQGRVFQDNVPVGSHRYLRLFYIGSGITAGVVCSGLNIDGPNTGGKRYYPRNYQA